ncbi:MAG TPA: DNA mismatch repair endonuclease MutL [Longimicrobiales bacterium]|nr:DNA mismatch repair endonuclease MutL [Longimicrobiales bacterium]
MTRRIHILPDALANQIAAGEVVERPASVVKELIENALDAAATRVHVSIQNGGKTEIRVADDGCGMGRDDALLCLDRHATSKIAQQTDLQEVRTFGFRGEALPSIASVARLTIESAEPGGVGTRVRVNGGRISGAEDCARQSGTTVAIRNLFFNVPARAKFLRSAAAETRAIADVVTTLALSNLSTAFTLESNGRTLIELPVASDLTSRVAALWGDDTARKLIPLSKEKNGITVAGLIERPDATVSGPRRAHLFIAGRPFKDRDLVFAVERAYRTTVPLGTKPSLLLYLTVPPGDVDVNVHPAKAEVRFRAKFDVEAVIEAAVRDALATVHSAATLDQRPAYAQQLDRAPFPRSGAPSLPETIPQNQLAFFVPSRQAYEPTSETSTDTDTLPMPEERERPVIPRLWQFNETYILAETRSGLLIIDQHSAHERIMFEQIMRGFSSGTASQRLIFPLTLRLSPAEYSVVEENTDLFNRAGFEIEPFGSRTVIVHGAPAPHPYFNAERCLKEMLAELAAGSELTRAATNQHERIAMTFACKGAIKAGQKLSDREMAELFEKLFTTELPYHDVHGRSTVVRLSLDELIRRFGRHG